MRGPPHTWLPNFTPNGVACGMKLEWREQMLPPWLIPQVFPNHYCLTISKSGALRPVRAKDLFISYHSNPGPIGSLLPLQGDIINILIPRALPWAIVTLGFQPVILQWWNFIGTRNWTPYLFVVRCKDNVKIRWSERNGDLLSFPSVRILCKSNAELQVYLIAMLRCSLSYE